MPEHASITIQEKGTIHIIEDNESESRIAFIIDGQKFTADELTDLLSPYTDFMIQYQIHDDSEPILKGDDYLMPVHITGQSLIDELEEAICIHSDNGFISYKDTAAFDNSFYKITDKLEVLYHSNKKDNAVVAGKEMIRILTQTETDDDYFPEFEIESLCKIIDPFGLDEELKVMVQDWN